MTNLSIGKRIWLMYGASSAIALVLGTGWLLSISSVREALQGVAADSSKGAISQAVTVALESSGSGVTWCWILMAISVVIGGALAFNLVRGTRTSLGRLVDELHQSVEQVASAAVQISTSSQSLAQGTSQQAASLEETSASSEEMTSMTRKNADNSAQSAQLMSVVDSRVADANRTLEQMVASMNEINSSSEKISRIIKVIDEIAFQTNILALNAAVEAARAGQAGMGFAVVADEVRNLAERSAQAAKDTAVLIEDSIAKTNEGGARLTEVTSVIKSITESANRVKTLVDEVNLGSQEQARGVEQISKAITQIEQVTQRAAASAEETASAGEELGAQSKAMQAALRELRHAVGEQQSAVTSWKPKAVSRTHQLSPKPGKTLSTAAVKTSHVKREPVAVASHDIDRSAIPLEDDFKEF